MTRRRSTATALAAMALAALGLGSPVAAPAAPAPAWRLIAATGPTNLPPFAGEIQRLLIDAEGGEFKLSLSGGETGPIAFDASAGEVRSALESLPEIGTGNVEVSGGPGDASAGHPYFVRFAGALSGQDVAQLGADSTLLTGAGHSAGVATETNGGTPGEATIAAYVTDVGAAAGSGPVTVKIGPLPSGISTAPAPAGNGTGWTCLPAGAGQSSVECASSASVAPGETAPPVVLPIAIGAGAPASSTVPLTAGGGGAAEIAGFDLPLTVSAQPAPAGIESFWAGSFDEEGKPSTQAGGHPNLAATGFLVNTVTSAKGEVVVAGDLRNVAVDLPPGFVGNPLLTKRCPQNALLPNRSPVLCTSASQVGVSTPVLQTFAPASLSAEGLYNDEPPFGYPAEFSFPVVTAPVGALASVRSDGDYGVTISAPDLPQEQPAYGSFFTLLGNPPGAAGKAFLTNPTDCAGEAAAAPLATIRANSWQDQDPTAVDNEISVPLPPVTGCDQLQFHPALSFQPAAHEAAAPTAFDADLQLPEGGFTDPDGLASPQLKRAVVSLPAGVDLNPSAANGLAACTEQQIGLKGTDFPAPSPIRFDKVTPSCPDASKLGTVEAETPVLAEPVRGTIYLAAQDANPFHSLLALYLVFEDPRDGILVKLPGEVRPRASDGRLTTVFDNNPQLPVGRLQLHFRGGPRSSLATPDVCGTYVTVAELTPWSAPDSGPPAESEDSFSIGGGPGGGACATSAAARPFAPSFEAGTASIAAGAYAPLTVRLARRDGEQEMTRLELDLPPGVSGRLAGVAYCPDAAIEAARSSSGTREQATPSCPSASRLGSVDTTAGVGSEPIRVSGRVYLAGPYEGAPLSTVVITPAVAGPFDLGVVVVRAPVYVDPGTAQLTVRSDPIPTILEGIPLHLRSLAIDVARDEFVRNPTSCAAMSVSARLSGASGAGAAPGNRFQVDGCAGLAFGPKLKLSLKGGTRRGRFPALKAVLTQPAEQAGIHYAQVTLPRSEILEQAHIRTVCTRVQFDAVPRQCPAESVYGRARAWSPLLDAPLEGPVYLRSNGGERQLPDLVAALRGPDSQPIEVDLVGYVDSVHQRLRNTFALVPDAPVSRFVLEMRGGGKGLLVNSHNLCAVKLGASRATARLVGQNGKRADRFPLVGNGCGKGERKHRRHRAAG